MRPILILLMLWPVAFHVNGQAMKRILSRDTPAHRAAMKFMRGVNIGNALEYGAGNGAGGLTYTASDFTLIRNEGFDHVRVPVAWHLFCEPGPDFTVNRSIFTSVDAYMNGALAKGLSVIIDWHHFADLYSNPSGAKDQFYKVWVQIAEHYAGASERVAFELLNEPNNRATTAVMNPIYAETIRQVRVSNPNRTIFVGPGEFNGILELKITGGLLLPDNDDNLIATVHCYDPYYFTHQGAEWALPGTATVGVVYPGPPSAPIKPSATISHSWVLDWFRDYNSRSATINPSSSYSFRSKLRALRTWSDYFGRPVHVGEFGCYERAGAPSRVNFHRDIRATMDEYGLGWAMWDWKAGFHYIKNGRPDPIGMRDAIFPPIELSVSATGAIEFDGAAGKTYIVQKTDSLTPPLSWQNVTTVTLTSPRFSWEASNDAKGGGFYRVQWVK